MFLIEERHLSDRDARQLDAKLKSLADGRHLADGAAPKLDVAWKLRATFC